MTMPDDRTPTGGLRDRLREALITTASRQAREKGIKLSAFTEATIRANAEALADAVLPVVEAETAALRQRAEDLASELRAVKIDRDEWRARAHHWQATAGPPEDSDEYDLDTDPDALRRNLIEVIEFLEGRPAKMVHDAVWARVRPVLRIHREKLTEQRERAEQAERERDEERAIRQQAEEIITIAHNTSNQSERERVRAVQRAETAERQRDDALDAVAAERRDKLAAQAANRRVRAFFEDMRTWCSPYGVAADYAQRGLTALDAEPPRDEALDLLRELTDTRPCDPHPGTGWCQTHGQRPPCPHAAAKQLLAALDEGTTDGR